MASTKLAEKLEQLQAARDDIAGCCHAAGVSYPPTNVAILAIKNVSRLELWAERGLQKVRIKTYPILAASGVRGPKLCEGDRQVPEGIYPITALNPESRYHLSLRVGYPNAFDLKWAQAELRSDPGSDIYIHGGARSVGCLAMGDAAIEELFVLAADVGIANVKVLIAPQDPRHTDLCAEARPGWVAELYRDLAREFSDFRL